MDISMLGGQYDGYQIRRQFGWGLFQETSDPDTMAEGASLFIMDSKDSDGDGALTIEELGVSEDKFNELDTDGDGVVDSEELEAAFADGINSILANLHTNDSEADDETDVTTEELSAAEKIFGQIDADGDGVVDEEEFKAAFQDTIGSGLKAEMMGLTDAPFDRTRGMAAYLAILGGLPENSNSTEDSGGSTDSSALDVTV